jgi:hypothetical protein
MTSQFLEDLTTAGNFVWEYYLQPFAGKGPSEPPHFPVWEKVPEVESFKVRYGGDYDWRVWMGWAVAFSSMATRSAEALNMSDAYWDVHKFTELTAVHMGDRCPGNHAAERLTADAVLSLGEYAAPTWHFGSRDIDRFRFEVAAHQEWLYLQGTYIPERELLPARAEEVMTVATDIENDLFKDAELETLLGLLVLASHMATLGMANYTTAQEEAARRALCVQSHGMTDAVRSFVVEAQVGAHVAEMLRQAGLN